MGEVPKSYSKFNLNCVCVFLVKAMYLFVCVCWNDYPEARYKYPFSEISQHIQSIRALFSRSSSWSRWKRDENLN